MSRPTFGMTFSRSDAAILPAIGADFSKVVLIETSEDAVEERYPLNTGVRISTGDAEAVAALGTGMLRSYVQGINDQLTSLNAGADVTIVRVKEEETLEATCANIVSVLNNIRSVFTSVKATARIFLVGRTAWRPDVNTTNPVIAALETVLPKVLAVAPVDVDDSSMIAAISARETMTSARVMPIGVAARVWEQGEVVTRPMAPRVVGLMIRVDNGTGGYPFDPFANRPIYGLAGLSRDVDFDLLDGSVEGQQMLASNVSIVADGEIGRDGAIADGGYHFIGTDNAKTGTSWEQIHQVRGADFITTEFIGITRQFLGRKISASNLENWIISESFALRDHKSEDRIVGYAPRNEMFRPDLNSPENIRKCTVKLVVGIEPTPTFKVAEHEITPYRPALEGLVEELVQRLSSSTIG